MIYRKEPNDSWSADLRIALDDATDLQSLLDALVQRYALLGGVIATHAGAVLAQTGSALTDLKQLAAAIDPTVLPRYFANGPFDAYVDIVGDGLIALLMRERGDPDAERTQLAMVADYNVAKDMTEELRFHIQRITESK